MMLAWRIPDLPLSLLHCPPRTRENSVSCLLSFSHWAGMCCVSLLLSPSLGVAWRFSGWVPSFLCALFLSSFLIPLHFLTCSSWQLPCLVSFALSFFRKTLLYARSNPITLGFLPLESYDFFFINKVLLEQSHVHSRLLHCTAAQPTKPKTLTSPLQSLSPRVLHSRILLSQALRSYEYIKNWNFNQMSVEPWLHSWEILFENILQDFIMWVFFSLFKFFTM